MRPPHLAGRRREIGAIEAALGLRQLSSHSFRSGLAMLMAAADFEPMKIRDALRHSDIRATTGFVRPQDTLRAGARMHKRLEAHAVAELGT